jgi:hypothetical protein
MDNKKLQSSKRIMTVGFAVLVLNGVWQLFAGSRFFGLVAVILGGLGFICSLFLPSSIKRGNS